MTRSVGGCSGHIVLFNLGTTAIGLYISKSSFDSTYGAAGSLVVLLIWMFLSTQILLIGAEFTQIYARSQGK
jgi:membrane protein